MDLHDLLFKKKSKWDKAKTVRVTSKKQILIVPVPDDNIEQFKIRVGSGKYVNNFKIKQSLAL